MENIMKVLKIYTKTLSTKIIENEKIFSQIIRVSWVCDQNVEMPM